MVTRGSDSMKRRLIHAALGAAVVVIATDMCIWTELRWGWRDRDGRRISNRRYRNLTEQEQGVFRWADGLALAS